MGSDQTDHLARIVSRKRVEVVRRRRHRIGALILRSDALEDRATAAHAALRRQHGAMPRVIAEIKHASPSAGTIHPRAPGGVVRIARRYVEGGAAAVSVLCDRVGFGGGVLDVRRVRGAVSVPIVFKEFVLDPLQVALARRVGADMVLLLVRALPAAELNALVAEVQRLKMAPVVEAADEAELELALATQSTIVGVNARDLRTFRVDPGRARTLIARIPSQRIAVHMSGITSAADLQSVAETRADAVLIGEALMRADDPAERLREWLRSPPSQG